MSQMRRLALRGGAAIIAFAYVAATTPAITEIAHPVHPGDVLTITGAWFASGPSGNASTCTVVVTPTSDPSAAVVLTPDASTASDEFLAARLPSTLPLDVYSVTVNCSGVSSPWFVNKAEPWWIQGDAGDTASIDASGSGWLRVVGLSLSVAPLAVTSSRIATRRSARRLLESRSPSDLLQRARRHVALEAQAAQARASVAPTLLQLTPVAGGSAIVLTSIPENTTSYSALFAVPSDVAPGAYNASVSNGYGGAATWTALDVFISSDAPHVTGITLAPRRAWPAGVFAVDTPTEPKWLPANTSDTALAAALAAAAAAGGGTVFFPTGLYYLSQPIVVPPNTVLQGAGMDATAIYFVEANVSTAPQVYITMNQSAAMALPSGHAAWGVTDLALHITAFHNTVLYVSNITRGFVMQRVRARVNADFAGNVEGTTTRSRALNWTWESTGPLVDMHAVGWEISDCDLYSTFNVITSYTVNWWGTQYPWRHASSYGLLTRNNIWNGGSPHFMNQWMQSIVEFNVIRGVALMSMGSSAGTGPGGGVVQNLYVADNNYQHVYGNDREVQTTDCQGGAYFGTLAVVNGTTLVTTGDTWPSDTMEWGGWYGAAITIGNGTGAGQWRRVVVPGALDLPNLNNRTWVIDRPFDVLPEPGVSFVEIHPFRGRMMWIGNSYADVGAFQFFGHALNSIVAENTLQRGVGFIAWGQDLGWTPPPTNWSEVTRIQRDSASRAVQLSGTAREPGVGWTWSDGWQPNMHVQWLYNTVEEAVTDTNYNCDIHYYDQFYAGYRFIAFPTTGWGRPGPAQPPVNMFITWRGNSGVGTGITIGMSTSFSVLDNNAFDSVEQLPFNGTCIAVDPTSTTVFVSNNTCTVGATGGLDA